MMRLRSLLSLLATLAVALGGCGESRRSAAPLDGGMGGGGGTTGSGGANGGQTDAPCADCDGGTCINGLCCSGDIATLRALEGVPCSTAGQFCGPGDCTLDAGFVHCKNGICRENYQCSNDGTGNLIWDFQVGPCVK